MNIGEFFDLGMTIAFAMGLAMFVFVLIIPFITIVSRRFKTGEANNIHPLPNRESEEFEALKKEIQSLRDTSTQYDMSLDASLQRLESSIHNLEQRIANVENANNISILQQKR
jgi:predicted PurR-regulated permease PerM